MTESRSRLGRYELGPRISAGGMGTVYRATLRGASGFARPFAIKTLHPHMREDANAIRRFLREARLGACVRHANVVPIVDVDVDVEPYLVMELVEGSSLATTLRKTISRGGLVPVPLALAIACDVLAGLQAVHDACDENGQRLGLVHLDISPQNVLVGRDGVARIVDFGIARALELSPVTMDAGKLRYIAPEQVEGSPSPRSDLHSTAIVLWELLTGANYRTGQAQGPRWGVNVPPSVARSDVPPALDELVLRGLRFDPAERYGSAHEMRAALERVAPRATATEVAAWLASLDVLDRDSDPAPAAVTCRVSIPETTARVTRRLRPAVAVIAPVAMIVGFVLAVAGFDRRHVVKTADAKQNVHDHAIATEVPATPPLASEPTAPPAPAAERDPSALPPEVPPKAAPAPTPAPRKKSSTARSRPSPKCASPYIVLPDGRKHFRLECLE